MLTPEMQMFNRCLAISFHSINLTLITAQKYVTHYNQTDYTSDCKKISVSISVLISACEDGSSLRAGLKHL